MFDGPGVYPPGASPSASRERTRVWEKEICEAKQASASEPARPPLVSAWVSGRLAEGLGQVTACTCGGAGVYLDVDRKYGEVHKQARCLGCDRVLFEVRL